jgi:hypothetical protein
LSRCSTIKGNGERCKGVAIRGYEWCPAHHPDYQERRRRAASRGGKAGGRGRPQAELSDIKRRLSELAEGVLEGSVERGTGAVVSQILNVYLRAVSVELKVREVTELEARIEALERAQDEQRGAKTWQRG